MDHSPWPNSADIGIQLVEAENFSTEFGVPLSQFLFNEGSLNMVTKIFFLYVKAVHLSITPFRLRSIGKRVQIITQIDSLILDLQPAKPSGL